MFVSFLSFDQDKNKTSFQSEAKQNDNEIIFEDKSCPNTNIKISFLKNSFILERFGSTEMFMQFCLDKPTKGTYKNAYGLEFEFMVQTKTLTMDKNKVKVCYDMVMDQEVISTLTFQVVLFEN
ncbi:MAG: DUF1934 domain-containing protein [Anaeroplasmataceae bacterium]|nr:DUF1934 domain-containing protein [Anaeroplasmataceae bacterium]